MRPPFPFGCKENESRYAGTRAIRAVIIIPSQGSHQRAFELVALGLSKDAYNDAATIVKTTLTESNGKVTVTFNRVDGSAFSWLDVNNLSTVMTISHSGEEDGPNLAPGMFNGNNQPWDYENGNLTESAKSFWGKVRNSLDSHGKIILLGCSMGHGPYAGSVSQETGRTVYAAPGSLAAGNKDKMLKHVRAIEKGTMLPPMEKFDLRH